MAQIQFQFTMMQGSDMKKLLLSVITGFILIVSFGYSLGETVVIGNEDYAAVGDETVIIGNEGYDAVGDETVIFGNEGSESADPTADALVFYNFENGALTTDSSGNGRTLTANNTPTADTSIYKIGAASVLFQYGEPDYYHITTPAWFPTGDLTVTFWMRYSNADNMYIVCKYDTTSNRQFAIQKDASQKISVRIGYNGGDSSEASVHASAMTANQWYFIGVTWEASSKNCKIRIWDDNASAILGTDIDATHTNAMFDATADFTIAAQDGGSSAYNGRVDAVRLWDRVLTASEIDQVRDQ